MGVSAPAAPKANGLTTVLNVFTAPSEAFQTLRPEPMWGWAFVIAVVLTAIGNYLAAPAMVHSVQASFPQQIAANPQLAGMSPEQQQHALGVSLAFVKLSWLWSPITVLIGTLVTAVLMLIFKIAGRGDASFKQLWCAAMNVSVVAAGAAALLNGLVAVVRGASSYSAPADIYRAVPSLAWLVPHGGVKLVAFLAAFNVVGIWAAVLVALAMVHVARTSKANGAACGILLLVIGGAFLALGAR